MGHRDRRKHHSRQDVILINSGGFQLIACLAYKFQRLQTLGFTLFINIRAPREAGTSVILRTLDLLAYGLTDTGEPWSLTSDEELIKRFGIDR